MMYRKRFLNIQNSPKNNHSKTRNGWKIYIYSQFFKYQHTSDDIGYYISAANSKDKYLFLSHQLSNPIAGRDSSNLLSPQFLQFTVKTSGTSDHLLTSIRNSPYVAVGGFTSLSHNNYRFYVPIEYDGYNSLAPPEKTKVYSGIYSDVFEYFENEIGLMNLKKENGSISQCFRPLYFDQYFINNITTVNVYNSIGTILPEPSGQNINNQHERR